MVFGQWFNSYIVREWKKIDSRTSDWMQKTRDDEDKGSPLQDGANLTLTLIFSHWERAGRGQRKNRQISGSPSGVPSPVSSFPPKKKSCSEYCREIWQAKLQEMVNMRSEIGGWQQSLISNSL